VVPFRSALSTYRIIVIVIVILVVIIIVVVFIFFIFVTKEFAIEFVIVSKAIIFKSLPGKVIDGMRYDLVLEFFACKCKID
jgi:hypothetical protein